MTIDDWRGGRLGDGPVVVSADRGDDRPPTGEMAVYASVGPDHRAVRVRYDQLAAFFAEHADTLFVSRDVAAIAAPLLARGSATAGAVAARTKAGTWVDVGELLGAVFEQLTGFVQRLKKPALWVIDQATGDEPGDGLRQLARVYKVLLGMLRVYRQPLTDRQARHRTSDELCLALDEFAAVLSEEAFAMSREFADRHRNGHNPTGQGPISPVRESLPASPTACPGGRLGNRVDVWDRVVRARLEWSELTPDPQAAVAFRWAAGEMKRRAVADADRHRLLEECFDRGTGDPVEGRLSGWLTGAAQTMIDLDRSTPRLPPLRTDPYLEGWGFWGASDPRVAACRKLLRCRAHRQLLRASEGGGTVNARDGLLTVYRRVAAAEGCPVFGPHQGHVFYVIRPVAAEAHTLSAVLARRGHTAGAARLADILNSCRSGDLRLDVYGRIAAELEWHWRRPGRSADRPDESALREFHARLEQRDADCRRWVRTACGLLKTVAFGVEDGMLASVLGTEYALDWSAREVGEIRSLLADVVLPELGRYWGERPEMTAAARLELNWCKVSERLDGLVTSITAGRRTPERAVRSTLGIQLMGCVNASKTGRVIDELATVWQETTEGGIEPSPSSLSVVMLTRTLTPGGRVAGPAYPAEVRRREFDMACEELMLGISHELIADGFGVAAVTPDEILIEEPAGRVTQEQIRMSAEAGACRVLAEHTPPIRVTEERRW